MSADEVDHYLSSVEEPKRTTLAQLRQTIREIIPEATAKALLVDREALCS